MMHLHAVRASAVWRAVVLALAITLAQLALAPVRALSLTYDVVADAPTHNLWRTAEGERANTRDVGTIHTDKSVVAESYLTIADAASEEALVIERPAGAQLLTDLSALSSSLCSRVATETPLEVVLVLDVSGSMNDPVSYEPTYTPRTSETYYVRVGDSYQSVDYRFMSYSYGQWRTSSGTAYAYKTSADDTNPSHVQFYVGSPTSRLSAMKDAAAAFLDILAEANESREAAVRHRVSVVKFAGGYYLGTGTSSDAAAPNDSSYTVETTDSTYNLRLASGWTQPSRYTRVVADLTHCTSGSNLTALKGKVRGLAAEGATAANKGLTLAKAVFDGTGSLTGAREGAKRVVVFLTDGQPTYLSDYDPTVAAAAVDVAKSMKDEGATVFSVGVSEEADPADTSKTRFNVYMNAVSSNYPQASGAAQTTTGVGELDTRANDGTSYYVASSSADELGSFFKNVADTISSTDSVVPVDLTDTEAGGVTFTDELGAYQEVKGFEAIAYSNDGLSYGLFDRSVLHTSETLDEATGDTVVSYVFDQPVIPAVTSGEPNRDAIREAGTNLSGVRITVRRRAALDKGDVIGVYIPPRLVPLRETVVTSTSDGGLEMVAGHALPIHIVYSSGTKATDDNLVDQLLAGTGQQVVEEALKSDGDQAAWYRDFLAYEASHAIADGRACLYANRYDAQASSPDDAGAVFRGATTARLHLLSRNQYYYFTDDTPLLRRDGVAEDGTYEPVIFSGNASSLAGYALEHLADWYCELTYYRATGVGVQAERVSEYVPYANDATALPAAEAVAMRDDGTLYVPAGTLRWTAAAAYDREKGSGDDDAAGVGPNASGTARMALVGEVDVESSTVSAYLGNNARLSPDVSTGSAGAFALSKEVEVARSGLVAPDAAFAFSLLMLDADGSPLDGTYPAAVLDASGTQTSRLMLESHATCTLHAGETLKVAALPAGTRVTCTEALKEGFSPSVRVVEGARATTIESSHEATVVVHVAPTTSLAFENTFSARTTAVVRATKVVAGNAPAARYGLSLYASDGFDVSAGRPRLGAEPVATAAIESPGGPATHDVTLNPSRSDLTYEAPTAPAGDTFYLVEDAPVGDGVATNDDGLQTRWGTAYDTLHVWTVRVRVANAAGGGLVANVAYAEGIGEAARPTDVESATFTNAYEATGTASVLVSKRLMGRALSAGEFRFVLADASGRLLSGEAPGAVTLDDATGDQLLAASATHATAGEGEQSALVELRCANLSTTWLERVARDDPSLVSAVSVEERPTYTLHARVVELWQTLDGSWATYERARQAGLAASLRGMAPVADASGHAVDITLTDDGAGTLVATLPSPKICVENRYEPVPVSTEMGLSFSKRLVGRPWREGDAFAFRLVPLDASDGTPARHVPTLAGTHGESGTLVVAAPAGPGPSAAVAGGSDAGEAIPLAGDGIAYAGPRLTYAYDDLATRGADGSVTGHVGERTFAYQLSEVAPEDGALHGITYDSAVLTLEVHLRDVGGTLEVATSLEGFDADAFAFVNTYHSAASYEADAAGLVVRKRLDGHGMAEGQFGFSLVPIDTVNLPAGASSAARHGSTAADAAAKAGIEVGGMMVAGEAAAAGDEVVLQGLTSTLSALTFSQDDFRVAGSSGDTYVRRRAWSYEVREVVPAEAERRISSSGDVSYVRDGYVYDGAVRTVTVGAIDNYDGTIAIETRVSVAREREVGGEVSWDVRTQVYQTGAGIVFENAYEAATSFAPSLDKVLEGALVSEANVGSDEVTGHFRFGLGLDGGDPLVWGTVAGTTSASGEPVAIGFDSPLRLTTFGETAGKTINLEAAADGAGVPYGSVSKAMDPVSGNAVYTVRLAVTEDRSSLPAGVLAEVGRVAITIEVADRGDGTLMVLDDSVSGVPHRYPDGQRFVNVRTSGSASVRMRGEKRLDGRAIRDGEFAFSLMGEPGAPMPAGVQDGVLLVRNEGQDVDFGTLSYDVACLAGARDTDGNGRVDREFSYAVHEVAGTLPGVTYDALERRVKVRVEEPPTAASNLDVTVFALGGDGEWKVAGDTPFSFVNTFDATPIWSSPTEQVRVIKRMEGRPLVADDGFVVALTDAEGAIVTTGPETDRRQAQATMALSDGAEVGDFGAIPVYFTQDDVGKTYEYRLVELRGSRGGVTYDTRAYDVVAHVGLATDADATPNGLLSVAWEVPGADDISGQLGVVFSNAYAASPVTTDARDVDALAIGKRLEGRGRLSADEAFAFTIVPLEGAPSIDGLVDGDDAAAGVQLSVAAPEHAGETVTVPFGGSITFEHAGTFAYELHETLPADATQANGYRLNGLTYDTHVRTVVFEVVDDGKGHLVIADVSASGDPTFVNTYVPYGTLGATKSYAGIGATQQLVGRNLAEDTFELHVEPQSAAAAAKLGARWAEPLVTTTHGSASDAGLYGAEGLPLDGAAGEPGRPSVAEQPLPWFDELTFSLDDLAGVAYDGGTRHRDFVYHVREVDAGSPGYTYDTAVRVLTITLADDGVGHLTTTTSVQVAGSDTVLSFDDGVRACLPFSNTYEARGSVAVHATKTLVGRALAAGEFSFALERHGQGADNARIGGTRQVAVNVAGSYDVTNDAATGAVDFAPVSLSTDDLRDEVRRGIIAKPTWDATTGVATYTLSFDASELVDGAHPLPPAVSVVAGADRFGLTVVVRDAGEGTLTAEVHVRTADGAEVAGISFRNAYEPTCTVEPLLTKLLDGYAWADRSFDFVLTAATEDAPMPAGTAAGERSVVATVTRADLVDGQDVARIPFGPITYRRADLVGGLTANGRLSRTFAYMVREAVPDGVHSDGISYATNEVTYVVTVVDDGSGMLAASVVTQGEYAPGTASFRNVGSTRSYDGESLVSMVSLAGRPLLANELAFEVLDRPGAGHEARVWASGMHAGAADGAQTPVRLVMDELTLPELAAAVTRGAASFCRAEGARAHDGVGTFCLPLVVRERTDALPPAVSAVKGTSSYDVTLVVIADGDGHLHGRYLAGSWEAKEVSEASADDAATTLLFKNVYAPASQVSSPTEDVLSVGKVVVGREGAELAEGEFEFALTPLVGSPLRDAAGNDRTSLVARNEADGTVSLPRVMFCAQDVAMATPDDAGVRRAQYRYLLSEVPSARDDGVTCDATTYTLVADVSDEGGALSVSWKAVERDGEAAQARSIVFENGYDATGTVQVRASKALVGRPLRAGEFSFVLEAEGDDGVSLSIPRSLTAANGEPRDEREAPVSFPALALSLGELRTAARGTGGCVSYDATTGVYTLAYTLREAVPAAARANEGTWQGVTYDMSVYHVYVEARDCGDGTLLTAVSYRDANGVDVDAPSFVNVYVPVGEDGGRDVGIVVQGAKEMRGRPLGTAETFGFTMSAADDAPLHVASAETVSSLRASSAATGAAGRTETTVTFPEMTFSAADLDETPWRGGTRERELAYVVAEDEPADGQSLGITNGDAQGVLVDVTDDGEGRLGVAAETSGGADGVAFRMVNTYAAAPVTTALTGVTKGLAGRRIVAGEFSFALTDEADRVVSSGVVRADGSVVFDALTFSRDDLSRDDGTYDTMRRFSYTLSEVMPEGAVVDADGGASYRGVRYDTHTYPVSVCVSDDSTGTLKASWDTTALPADGPTFSNVYDATGTAHVEATKRLDGRALGAGEFAFALEAAGGVPSGLEELAHATATNQAQADDGTAAVSFALPALSLSRLEAAADAGGFVSRDAAGGGYALRYTLREVMPADGATGTGDVSATDGLTYDVTSYDVVVLAQDGGDGTLAVRTTYARDGRDVSGASFVNVYAPADAVSSPTREGESTLRAVSVRKALAGATLEKGAFSFELTAIDGSPLRTADGVAMRLVVANGDADETGHHASVALPSIVFTYDDLLLDDGAHAPARTFSYRLREVLGDVPHVAYDETEHVLAATLCDDGTGRLSVTWAADGAIGGDVTFENAYVSPASATILATTTLFGRDQEPGEFHLTLLDEAGRTVPLGDAGAVSVSNPTRSSMGVASEAFVVTTLTYTADALEAMVAEGSALEVDGGDDATEGRAASYVVRYRVSEDVGRLPHGVVALTAQASVVVHVDVAADGEVAVRSITYPRRDDEGNPMLAHSADLANAWRTREVVLPVVALKRAAHGTSHDFADGELTFTITPTGEQAVLAPLPMRLVASSQLAGEEIDGSYPVLAIFGTMTVTPACLEGAPVETPDGWRERSFSYIVHEVAGSLSHDANEGRGLSVVDGVTYAADRSFTLRVSGPADGSYVVVAAEGLADLTFENAYGVDGQGTVVPSSPDKPSSEDGHDPAMPGDDAPGDDAADDEVTSGGMSGGDASHDTRGGTSEGGRIQVDDGDATGDATPQVTTDGTDAASTGASSAEEADGVSAGERGMTGRNTGARVPSDGTSGGRGAHGGNLPKMGDDLDYPRLLMLVLFAEVALMTAYVVRNRP